MNVARNYTYCRDQFFPDFSSENINYKIAGLTHFFTIFHTNSVSIPTLHPTLSSIFILIPPFKVLLTGILHNNPQNIFPSFIHFILLFQMFRIPIFFQTIICHNFLLKITFNFFSFSVFALLGCLALIVFVILVFYLMEVTTIMEPLKNNKF